MKFNLFAIDGINVEFMRKMDRAPKTALPIVHTYE
jgi:hypothetical protein